MTFSSLLAFLFLSILVSAEHGRFIVIFHSETPVEAVKNEMSRLEAVGATISHFYDGSAILGFAATIPDDQLVTLKSNGQIKYVEADGEVSAYAQKLLS